MKEKKKREMYKDIKGYEDRYQITSWGRVYSIESGRFLKNEKTQKGYYRVLLVSKNGRKSHHRVHRLVAQAFIPNPDNKPQVNHIDGNKRNNSISNLEWCTNQENCDHYTALMALAKNKK